MVSLADLLWYISSVIWVYPYKHIDNGAIWTMSLENRNELADKRDRIQNEFGAISIEAFVGWRFLVFGQAPIGCLNAKNYSLRTL